MNWEASTVPYKRSVSGSSQEFEANPEKIFAVVKALEITGEAVKKIPDDIRSQYPQIPWKDVAGMRDILVRQYWRVDVKVVWSTVQTGIPILKTAIIELTIRFSNDS